MDLLARRLARAALGLALALAPAGGCGGGARSYHVDGVVEAVRAEDGQVVVQHEDIEGYMPAMTMSFDAAPELLASVRPGQRIHFVLEVTPRSFRITELQVTGEVELGPDQLVLGDELVTAEPAPAFRLIDQLGEPLALADLAGRAVLLDFVFTRCPGPCPILTSTHVAVQRSLSPELRERSHFVSISIDPGYDNPARMRTYAERRGVDLTHWSFLTGPPDEVDAVVRSYGVGTRRQDDGELTHLVVTFLIDPEGRIVKRYVGLEHAPEEILADLRALLSAA